MSYDVNPISCNYINHGDANLPLGSKSPKNLCGETLYGFHREGEEQAIALARLTYGIETTGQFVGWLSLALGKFISSKEITANKIFSAYAGNQVSSNTKVNGFFGVDVAGTMEPNPSDSPIVAEGKRACSNLHTDLNNAFTADVASFKNMGTCMKYLRNAHNPEGLQIIDTIAALYTLGASVASLSMRSVSLDSSRKRWEAVRDNRCLYSFSASSLNLYLCNRNLRGAYTSDLRCMLNYNLFEPIRVLREPLADDNKDTTALISSSSIEFYKNTGVPDILAGKLSGALGGYMTDLVANQTWRVGQECQNAGSRTKLVMGIEITTPPSITTACDVQLILLNSGSSFRSKLLRTNCTDKTKACVKKESGSLFDEKLVANIDVQAGGGELKEWDLNNMRLSTKKTMELSIL